MLVPPDNFGLVEEGIYRCCKIDAINFAFLETLKLKSLVYLDAEKPARPLKNFLQDNKTNLYHLGGLKISNHNLNHTHNHNHNHTHTSGNQGAILNSNSRNVSTTSSNDIDLDPDHPTITDQLEKIELNSDSEKKDNEWMLIEPNIIRKAFEIILNKDKCNVLVVDSTATLIGILRKIQKWNFSSIFNEYRLYCSNKANYFAEIFLELIQIELKPFENESTSEGSQSPTNHTIPPQCVKFTPKSYSRKGSFGSFGSMKLSPPKFRKYSIHEIDNEEDDDEKLLSGSPQIPLNLLRLVELRKQQKKLTKDDENDFNYETINEESPPNSVNSVMSEESLGSSENCEYDINYYKILNVDVIQFSKVNIVQVKLPKEEKLPVWFKRSRDLWENEYRHLN